MLKQTAKILAASFLLLISILTLNGQDFFPGKRSFSILGEKTGYYNSIFVSSPTVAVSSPTPTSITTEYETVPSTPTPQEEAGADFLNYLEEKEFICYSGKGWLSMRNRIEEGKSAEAAGVAVSTAPRPAPPPLPHGLSVELPYESQLSISGRKTIGVSWKTTLYDKPEVQKRVNTSVFDMNQELQVRIKGRVGRKINVNVDFDDTTADKRDISVVYKGDPDEVVQEAAFGDIAMSLPSTEFVGYSKQLFGVKMDAKYKRNRTWAFFSRTKGLSEVKRFTGNTKLERKTIADTSYIPLKYYLIKFNGDTIKPGTVKIYRDDRNQSNNNVNTSTNTLTETLVDALTTSNYSYTGNFDLLVAGQDYTIDYNRGIVVFRSQVTSNYVLAIDYQREDGSYLSQSGSNPGALKIIKDESNTAGLSRELKTFYALGNVKIIRDNGRGNFLLRLEDLNANLPSALEPGAKPVPSYPNNIYVDFEAGIFNFEPPEGKPLPDDLYSVRTHRYNILAEYRYRIKFVTLKPGIVPQSERVSIDGKILSRDSDYFIDYDAGIVTFFDEEKINENTVIEVSYDYAPFGSSGGSTLVGIRSELSLTNNLFIGSSFIYDFAAKSQTLPDIRNTPSSLMVWEGDAKLQNIKVPALPLTMSFGGEYAISEKNPNIMNKALIESMEGIKQEDNSSMFKESWQPATNPGGTQYYSDAIVWDNEEVSRKAINPNIVSETDEKLQALNINYDTTRSNEVSIVQSLSNIGVDYSKKQYIEAWIHGDGKGEDLLIGYGSFNEDINGDGKLLSEDLNNDGTLNPGEDIGWPHKNPDGSITMIGAANNKIDSQDLDNNGVLNSFDNAAFPGPFGAGGGKSMPDINGTLHSSVDWIGWKLFKIPLDITTPLDWQAIKQVRITLRSSSGAKGNIKIASLSVINNRWEASSDNIVGSTLTISAVNNEDNVSYIPLFNNADFRNLYELSDNDKSLQKEQALSLKYELTNATTLAAKVTYGRPYDLSNYKQFNFFVYGNGLKEDIFFIQIGNDANYYEYSVPLYWTGWRIVNIYQYDINNDNKPERWAANVNGDTTTVTGATTKIVGTPSFQNISQIKLGVRASKGPKTSEIWVNDIHVTDSWRKQGYAWRADADFNIPGWMGFGIKRKEVNRNFETFSAGIYNRDYLEDSASANISRIPILPVSGNLTRTLTVTPSVVQNQSELVSLLEEGRVINYSGGGSASLNIPYMPKLSGQYTRAITDSQQIKRIEDRETLAGSFEYPNPLVFPIFPTNLSANYSVSNSFFRPWQPISKSTDTVFLGLDALNEYLEITEYNTLEISESWSARTPFQFWNGFTFSPSHTLRTVREKNKAFDKEHGEYLKSDGQTTGGTSSLRIFAWLQPNFSYNININENYNITFNTTTLPRIWPGQSKFIARDSSGEVSWNFQVRDLFAFPYTQSLGFSSSYRIQDQDSYDNVISSFNVLGFDNLWIRDNPLLPKATGYLLKSIIKKDDMRVSGRFNPFEAIPLGGRLSPIRTFATNFTYTGSEEHSFITGTNRDIYTKVWPDLLLSVNKWEEIMFLDRWLNDFQINFRHQYKTVETIKVAKSFNTTYGGDLRFYVLKKIDLNFTANTGESSEFDMTKEERLQTNEANNLSWSGQAGINIGRWRFTVRYDNGQSWAKDGTGKLTTQLFTHAYTSSIYSDMSFPNGVPIPFTNRTLPLTNRIIYNTTLKYSTQNSSLNIGRDNLDNYGVNMSTDYEVSQNFRVTVGAGWARLENRDKPEDNYQTLEASGRLTIQF